MRQTLRTGVPMVVSAPSGGGKTTLTDLVARFHDPTSGAIRASGVDLRNMKLETYRQKLATVPQEVFLFDGSVRDMKLSRRSRRQPLTMS